ncbi:MAG: ATP-binding cassette domain-containing protein [Lachnospiraceae bacterium]|nr:ATP-binding cassette domain-containing protein [Lachnospiraceae bacterium]
MDDKVIYAKNLSKEYKVKNTEEGSFFRRLFCGAGKHSVQALKEVSFSISEGEFVGLIGNNGAGKSTLVKLMTGILYPTGGELRIFGRDPFKERNKNNQEIGVVFGQRSQLKWDLSPLDSFRLLKVIYQIDSSVFEHNIKLFKELFDMEAFIGHPVRTLSLGQRMRCEIAAAFLHNPRIVFLDEPTIGLDVFSKDAIARFLNVMRKERKTTVILTTHDLEEMQEICDRAIILDEGKILLEEGIDALLRNYNQNKKIIFSTKNEKVCVEGGWGGLSLAEKPYQLVVDNVAHDQLPLLINAVVSKNDVVDISIEEMDFTSIIKLLLGEGKTGAC